MRIAVAAAVAILAAGPAPALDLPDPSCASVLAAIEQPSGTPTVSQSVTAATLHGMVIGAEIAAPHVSGDWPDLWARIREDCAADPGRNFAEMIAAYGQHQPPE